MHSYKRGWKLPRSYGSDQDPTDDRGDNYARFYSMAQLTHHPKNLSVKVTMHPLLGASGAELAPPESPLSPGTGHCKCATSSQAKLAVPELYVEHCKLLLNLFSSFA